MSKKAIFMVCLQHQTTFSSFTEYVEYLTNKYTLNDIKLPSSCATTKGKKLHNITYFTTYFLVE